MNLQYSGNSRYGQERAFPWLPSTTLKTEIYVPASQAADCLEFLAMFWNCSNRPLPCSKNPHFQNEAKCTTFLVKMSFFCMRMKNDFHIKGWAPTLVLKQRPGATRKWPIIVNASLGLQVPCGFADPSEFAAFHELSLAEGILLPPHLPRYPSAFTLMASLLIHHDLPLTPLVLSFVACWCKWGDCS